MSSPPMSWHGQWCSALERTGTHPSVHITSSALPGEMLSRRSLQALATVERQALWHQARRRGQCIRCFHAAIRRAAKHDVSGEAASQEESNKASPKANIVENVQARPGPPGSFDSASPHQPTKPASKHDRRWHQRSAMISEEVQMVQRDHPSPSFADVNPNISPQRPPPTAQTTNPEGSAMGENDPVSREGPTGQGIGKAVTTDEDVPDSTIMARGARSPHEGVEEPAEGGVAVVGTPGAGRQTARLAEEDEEGVDEEEEIDEEAPVQTTRRVPLPVLDKAEPPKALAKEDLLHRGYQTSTPAGGDMQSTLLDHMRMVAHPGEAPSSERDPQQLALKVLKGQLVHLHSAREKAIVERTVRGITHGPKRPKDNKSYEFAPVTEGVRKSIVDKLARGVYDPEGLLQGTQKYKNQPLLNQLAQQALKNGTYLSSDGDRFLRKVQSLLPRDVQAQKGARPQQAKAK